MPTHAEIKVLPHTPEQMFRLVADVEKYPEFLPWCLATRIKERNGDVLTADTIIGFKMFREKFTSRVELIEPSRINVTYSEGPFKYLNNHWIFSPLDGGRVEIDFYVDFEFKSKILQKVIGAVFNEAVQIMVQAFEKRARAIYGPPRPPNGPSPSA